jgi:hypothetical protein
VVKYIIGKCGKKIGHPRQSHDLHHDPGDAHSHHGWHGQESRTGHSFQKYQNLEWDNKIIFRELPDQAEALSAQGQTPVSLCVENKKHEQHRGC